jgi:cytochrome P450
VCIGASFSMAEASIILARFLSGHEVALDDDRPVTPVSIITTMPDVEPWFKLTEAP